MTEIINRQSITADGEYSFAPLKPGDEVLVEWDIVAGSATVEPGTLGLTSGLHRPARDLAGEVPTFAAAGGSLVILLGSTGVATLKVSSASSLKMKASITKLSK
jgi:hypothetical protein